MKKQSIKSRFGNRREAAAWRANAVLQARVFAGGLEWGTVMKTILLLEDESSLMKLLSQMLKRSGYKIWEAANADDAIRRFREASGRIDLLLADVTLPAISGIQVALWLRAEQPGLSVILTSGYPRTEWNARDAADFERLGMRSVMVVQKPFQTQMLLSCIRLLTEAGTAVAEAG